MEPIVRPTKELAAQAAAEYILGFSKDILKTKPRFSLAVSGGSTPRVMFDAMTTMPFDWQKIDIFQVDERIAPNGDPARNALQLEGLRAAGAAVFGMHVDIGDPETASQRYEEKLTSRLGDERVFDLIHLGLGQDGHTASLVPGDPILAVKDKDVAVTNEYYGHRRITFTYPVLNRARQILWFVTGADKAGAFAKLLARDIAIPAGKVSNKHMVFICDKAALGE